MKRTLLLLSLLASLSVANATILDSVAESAKTQRSNPVSVVTNSAQDLLMIPVQILANLWGSLTKVDH